MTDASLGDAKNIYGGAVRRVTRWIGEPGEDLCGPLTAKEAKVAAAAMEYDLLRGKKPVAKPRMLVAIGAPGSGKSTVAPQVIGNVSNYVNFDYDALIKYHPRAKEIKNIPDLKGKPTGIGYKFGWTKCVDAVIELGFVLLQKLIKLKYNLIVQTHNFDIIMTAKDAGYYCTVLYVVVKLKTAQKRARERAEKTGMFLTTTLAAQNAMIDERRTAYEVAAPFYGLWADEFIAVNNERSPARHIHAPVNITGTGSTLRTLIDAERDARTS